MFFSKNHKIKGKIRNPIEADMKESFVISITIGITSEYRIKKEIGDFINKIPIAVAIPLPPLNFKNIDQLCPITVKRPANRDTAKFPVIFSVKYTAKVPFDISKNKAIKLGTKPITNKTFDAPTFLVPNFLISFPLKSLATI